MTAPYDAEREARELRRRAEHVVDVARRADPDDAILYVLGTLASAHAAGLAQGRAEGAEAGWTRGYATALSNIARRPDEGPSYDRVREGMRDARLRLDECERAGLEEQDLAPLRRALPTNTTAREAEGSEEEGRG